LDSEKGQTEQTVNVSHTAAGTEEPSIYWSAMYEEKNEKATKE
jgi:hypothetical protein